MNSRINEELKREWQVFLNDYTEDKIRMLSNPKQYVIGYGKDNKSFCYMVEIGLHDLGSIRGASSTKFGLYYGKKGKGTPTELRCTKKFGTDPNKALDLIKTELVNLIHTTKQLSIFKDVKSKFGGMFKYKVMYLYNQKIMLPCFVKDDLAHFAKCLQIDSSGRFEELQQRLMKYRDNHHPKKDNHSFAAYLYNSFGRNVTPEEIKANDLLDKQLNIDIWDSRKRKKKNSLVRIETHSVRLRDPNVAYNALQKANFKCENDEAHYCFTRRKDDMPYTEVHHLIPMAFANEFTVDIDIEENIVSLCSNCHNEIHYGKNANKIIEKMYYQRIGQLNNAGITLSLEKLLRYYETINKKE